MEYKAKRNPFNGELQLVPILDDIESSSHAEHSDDQTAETVPTEESGITVQDHIDDTNNPHAVTKSQVGLASVPDVDATIADNVITEDTGVSVQDALNTLETDKSNKSVTINSQTTDYTLVLTDVDKLIDMDVESGTGILTVPKNSVVAFPIGTTIAIHQAGTVAITITPVDGDVIINNQNGLVTTGQYAIASLLKVAINTWVASGSVTPPEENCYGVSWDESADTYARTGDLLGQSVGQTLSNSLLPIQAKMRRCVIANNGTVNYYLGATDSTKKEDMQTASNLTGADGQVMVEIPKFWYKHSYAGTTHTWDICDKAKSGYSVHPAFLSDATELDYIYIGAYEAVLYDYSGASYIDYASGATITPAEDILSSVTGKKPVTNHTRANGRLMASNRGSGWTGILYDEYSAIQLLYLIEYASFNSQTMIGSGISNVTDWATYNNYFPIAPSGNSNSIGNASGNTAGSTSCATESTKYMSYRGIENFFGHLWKWLDGINTNNNRSYICNNAGNLADDTSSNYTDIGINNINADGYQSTLLNVSRGFLPASVGADSGTKITDYYYQSSGWRVAVSGGHSIYGLYAGFFFLHLYVGSASVGSGIGFRVCFRK